MDPYFAPTALRRLPLALLRDQNYPKCPAQTEAAAEQSLNAPAPAPIYMPQAAAYTRFKSQAFGAPGSSVVGMLAAMQQGVEQRQRLQAAALGRLGVAPQGMDLRTTAEPYNQMPPPSPVWQSGDRVALSRDAQPQNAMMTVERLNNFVRGRRATEILNRATKTAMKNEALRQVRQQEQHYQSVIAVAATTPWGLVQQ